MSDWRDQLDQLERRRWLDGANVEVWAGRLLLLMTGLVVIASVPALHPSPHDWIVIAAVSSVMLLVLAGTFMVPWTAPPGIGSVLFPLAVIFGLAALGRLTSAAIGSCYLGIFVLCFAYVGVCCPRRTGWLLLLPAVPGYVLAADRWDAYIEIRLAVAVAIWIVLAEVLAALMRRQHQVTALLEHAARTDELTGVGNRRDLDQRIASSRPGDTLVICDLDHFKLVNDTLGHAAGDQILQTFGATLL
ncbi:MAG: putative Diguanylate cyclase, partial [Frankiales bacterium]|nr:putative Diguanylate cyclase [Frankiales bacterium]